MLALKTSFQIVATFMRGGASLYSLWKAYRARRAAVRLLRPFVDRSRSLAGPMSEANWSRAYVVGFLTTLITAAAQNAVGELDGNALGLVQLEAWIELTEVPGDLIGERILSFSLNDDADFAEGCRNALAFGRALAAASRARGFAGDENAMARPDDILMRSADRADDLAHLWDRFIGRHLDASVG
jgi:hypothetical protein